MDIITVTKSRSMAGLYQYSVQRRDRTVFSDRIAGHDPAEAAATAVNAALKSSGAYMIFGPQCVLDQIPAELRVKK